MKSFTRKLFTLAVIALASGLIPLSNVTPKAEAQYMMGYDRGDRFDRDYRDRFRSDRFRHDFRRFDNRYYQRHFFRHRLPIRFRSDSDFFFRHNVFGRYPHIYRSFPGYIHPREFVIVNRNSLDRVIVRNTLTGPFSVNRAIIRVDDDFYDRFSSNFDFNQDIDIDVDTGSNTVRFNTVVGDFETGDVDIDID